MITATDNCKVFKFEYPQIRKKYEDMYKYQASSLKKHIENFS